MASEATWSPTSSVFDKEERDRYVRSVTRSGLVLLLIALSACTSARAPDGPKPPPTPRAITTSSAAEPKPKDETTAWAHATQSPSPPVTGAALAADTRCGEPDGVLAEVARRVASRVGNGPIDADQQVTTLLREMGVPHVRPRVLKAVAASASELDKSASVDRQLASLKREKTRCGVAIADPTSGGEGAILVAVAVDALADLEPLPTRARTGEWLTLAAPLHVNATHAKVVLLGPRGVPRTAPTTIDRSTKIPVVRARFPLDRPGAFTVQVVCDVVDQGPRPLLEARVFADVEPFSTDAPAPGEDVARPLVAAGSEDEEILTRMITTLRATESLGVLVRDPRLDALARAHAEHMLQTKRVAHDLGDGEGDLATRFENEGFSARIVGENVARSRSVALAHRALHASPSHRLNLLRADYTHLGVAVVKDDAGNVYVCEVFAGGFR